MLQLNLRLTREFERDLMDLMISAQIWSKTAAVRFAVHEVAAALRRRDVREDIQGCPHAAGCGCSSPQKDAPVPRRAL